MHFGLLSCDRRDERQLRDGCSTDAVDSGDGYRQCHRHAADVSAGALLLVSVVEEVSLRRRHLRMLTSSTSPSSRLARREAVTGHYMRSSSNALRRESQRQCTPTVLARCDADVYFRYVWQHTLRQMPRDADRDVCTTIDTDATGKKRCWIDVQERAPRVTRSGDDGTIVLKVRSVACSCSL